MFKDKWKNENPEKVKKWHDAYYERGRQNTGNEYQPWREIDDNILIHIHVSDIELAEILGRSVMAIQMRRYKLKKQGRLKE